MAEWVDVALVAAFPPGTVRTVEIDGTQIAVFNLNGNYHAIEDVCTHEAEALSDGTVEGEEIICPRHGARFSIITGAALTAPAYEPLAVIPVRIDDGMVAVKNDRRD